MRVFNILKRWLLVLVCAVSSVCAMEFTGEDVSGLSIKAGGSFEERLNSQSAALASQLQRYQVSYPEAGNVVVIGAAGAGKSTLITYLANKKLSAQEGDSGLYLDASDSAGGIKIGHTCEPGTVDITPFYAADEEMIYWDCPGFGDPRAGEYEIQNAMLIQQLFNSLRNVKVIVVAKEADLTGRALQFVELLEKLTMFKKEELESCVSLVIAKQRDISNVDKRLRTIEEGLDSRSAVYALVDYFLSNSERVSKFPYPKDEGDFDASNRPLIVQSLATTYVERLMCEVPLSAESREHIRGLAPRINAQIADFIRGDISRSIKAAVYDQISSAIERHDKTAEQLKELFGGYAARLVSLDAATYGDDLKSFLTELGLGDTVVNDSRFNLFSMLTTFGGLLEESLRAPDVWVDALVGIVGELDQLSKFETMKIISVIRDDYEFGDFKLERDIFKRNKWGKNEKKGEIWSKEIRKDISYYLRTAFVGGLILEEPVQHETLTVGKREGERDGGNWRN